MAWAIAAVAVLLAVTLAAPLGMSAGRTIRSVHTTPAVRSSSARQAHRRLSAGRRARMLDHAYPDALDLFVVSVQSGRSSFEALQHIRPYVHPFIAASIDETVERVLRGHRQIDALDAVVEMLGSRALAFVSTLATAERTGLAIGPMIERIADDARQHRRRQAETAARELPVRLAVPLVLCTLPSFVLVAIAPLLIGALSSLRGT